MLADGPLLSLTLAVLFGVLRFSLFMPDPSRGMMYGMLVYMSAFLLVFNLLQFLVTVIPIRYRVICSGMVSDGMQFIHVLKQKVDQSTAEEQK